MSNYLQPQFGHYWKLLKSFSSAMKGVAIIDAQGKSLWSNTSLKQVPMEGLAAQLFKQRFAELESGKVLTAVHDKFFLLSCAIHDSSGQLLYVMLTVVNRKTDDQVSVGKSVLRAVHSVRDIAANEISLLSQLDIVSEELGDRYEELNLLYSTESDLHDLANSATVVDRILEKTIMHLRVDSVCLNIPGRGINQRFSIAESTFSTPEMDKSVQLVLNKCLESGQTIDANDDKDSDNGDLFNQLGHKCLAIPMFDFDGAVEGILLVVNPADATNFTSSDRSLLGVIGQRLRWLLESNTDGLTGLPDRDAFEEHLESTLANCKKQNLVAAILNINIDRLHVINDMCGPQAGDQAIKKVGRTISHTVGSQGTVSRLGGDEFGVLLEDMTVKSARRLANQICTQVAALQFSWHEQNYTMSVSIGIGPVTGASNTTEELLSSAEIACNEAKSAGGGRAMALQRDDTVLLMRQDHMRWIPRIESAIRDSDFQLYAQPIVPLNAHVQHMHYEVLLRLKGKNGEIIGPIEFLPAAERYNLMPRIDYWVIEHFFSQLGAHWHSLDSKTQSHELVHTSWAINLSGQSMSNNGLLNFILERQKFYKLPSQILCFEVTESAAAHNIDDARRLIAALRAGGFEISLDDFGTGVSSFAYLRDLPVDHLKIDGSFVKHILEDIASEAVVRAIHHVAEVLKLKTIAEFVEDDAVSEKLREIGIDYGQGYAFAKPMPLDEALRFSTTQRECAEA